MAKRGDQEQKAWALHTLSITEQFRGRRAAIGPITWALPSPGVEHRTVYDAKNGRNLPGALVRGEGDPPSKDVAVNESYDGAGATYDFYMKAYQRNSIDDRGMKIDSSVHYDQNYDNAFWNGDQMVYGDGDGVIFQRFTKCLDVIGHELTHGVTQDEAALVYSEQPGALNESISDVFGSLVKQFALKQTAGKADWLIGEGLFTSKVNGVALRSMKSPGTAYNDPRIGKDPQPATMKDYVHTSQDDGGVHINSGIPNHAFYLTATAIGGYSWEKAGKIWYVTLRDRLRPKSGFKEAAQLCYEVAGSLFGGGSKEQKAVFDGWEGVGVTIKKK